MDNETEKPNPVVEAYKAVARTEAGKILFGDLLNECALFVNGFTGNSSTFFNLGRREIGLHVLRRLSGCNGIKPEAMEKFINYLTEGK